MTVQSVGTVYNQNNHYCLYDHLLIADFTPEMLTPAYWQDKGSVTGTAQGRGTTWFVHYVPQNQSSEQHWVLRHYYRGGFIGKMINDSYLFTGIENSRAVQEYSLLKQMQQWQLPAPKPIACSVIRHGLFNLCYRADLLSSRIEHAQDLVAILSQQSIDDDLWVKIGATIKRFHDHNIYHHDLNSHNILVDDQQEVYLIDFDRCEVRNTEKSTDANDWKESNMNRLKRSFLKEYNKLDNFHFNNKCWQLLQKGYSTNES
jgi:3-deoxy-D-manno-octulosonic acid kinase